MLGSHTGRQSRSQRCYNSNRQDKQRIYEYPHFTDRKLTLAKITQSRVRTGIELASPESGALTTRSSFLFFMQKEQWQKFRRAHRTWGRTLLLNITKIQEQMGNKRNSHRTKQNRKLLLTEANFQWSLNCGTRYRFLLYSSYRLSKFWNLLRMLQLK